METPVSAYGGYFDVVRLEPPGDRQVEGAYVPVDCEDLKAPN